MAKCQLDFKRIVQRIVERRKSMRITQEKLAEYANISTRFMSDIETGKKKPGFETMFYIAEALETTIDALTY